MLIVKVLKRKDAAALVVAVVLAMIVSKWLPGLVAELSNNLSGLDNSTYFSYATISDNVAGSGWQARYLQPAVSVLMQIIALELLIRLIVWLRPMFVRKG